MSSSLSLTLRLFIIALAVHGAFDLAGRVFAQEDHRAYVPVTQNPGSLDERVAALEFKLQNVVASSDTITVTGANLYVVNGEGISDTANGLGNIVVGYNEQRMDDKECRGTPRPNCQGGAKTLVPVHICLSLALA
jgi:hypothetical protein